MSQDGAAAGLISTVRTQLPEIAVDIDRFVCERLEIEPEEITANWTLWFERFSQLTTEAISRGDGSAATEHLKLVESIAKGADQKLVSAIDTYYVETLLFEIKDQTVKSWGWSLIPKSLQAMYIQMWGFKEFMS